MSTDRSTHKKYCRAKAYRTRYAGWGMTHISGYIQPATLSHVSYETRATEPQHLRVFKRVGAHRLRALCSARGDPHRRSERGWCRGQRAQHACLNAERTHPLGWSAVATSHRRLTGVCIMRASSAV